MLYLAPRSTFAIWPDLCGKSASLPKALTLWRRLPISWQWTSRVLTFVLVKELRWFRTSCIKMMYCNYKVSSRSDRERHTCPIGLNWKNVFCCAASFANYLHNCYLNFNSGPLNHRCQLRKPWSRALLTRWESTTRPHPSALASVTIVAGWSGLFPGSACLI